MILERWRLVDILLLRLPCYTVQLGEYRYIARGSRYGERIYEIFCPFVEPEASGDEERVDGQIGQREEAERTEGQGTEECEEEPQTHEAKVGQIEKPVAGPSYVVEADAAPLRQAPIVLAALVILIDTELYA